MISGGALPSADSSSFDAEIEQPPTADKGSPSMARTASAPPRAGERGLRGRERGAAGVSAMIVPGSQQVAKQAQAEGLDKIFAAAGFDFREPGCSACLGMNEDKVPAGEYCVSTSNRNFEGRQGPGARTILASPLTAAAAAVAGEIVDVRNWGIEN